MGMQYALMSAASGYRVSDTRFALEGAFVEHIRTLKEMLAPRVDRFVVVGGAMSDERYAKTRDYLLEVDEEKENIRFVSLWEEETGRLGHLLRELRPGMKRMRQIVQESDLVHSSPHDEVLRPLLLQALVQGAASGTPTISVTDMDNRDSARMMRQQGRLSLKSYLVTRFIYDPIRHLQQKWVVRNCDLVLYKGEALVEDYGRGRHNVRGIFDPGFSARHVISQEGLTQKLDSVRDSSRPIEAVYFGRFVEYKGVDHIVRAVARANDGGLRVKLTLWGFGPEQERLVTLAEEQLGADAFELREPVPYDDDFFVSLRSFDLSLAAPLAVDTPRSTWDSIASGVPVLGYDTEFYSGMANATGCVDVVPWPSPEAMGDRLREYADDRERLVALMKGTTSVALDNTQEEWLGRRVAWTKELLDEKGEQPPSPDAETATSMSART